MTVSRCTKLVCTLGPASATPKMVQGLARAGASVFRLNFSHGTAEEHGRMVALVREAEDLSGRALAVLADLPGPKVRLGRVDPDPFPFKPGQRFCLRPEGEGDARGAATTYPGLAGDLEPGDRVLLADGAVELTVKAIQGDEVVTECVRGGVSRSRQGVNVPAERLGLPAVTDRDREGLVRALDLGADFVAQSFVRSPDDVRELRGVMDDRAVPIVAKIETRPAVRDFDLILDEADAVMIARGDLGVELPMEEIPLIQKDLVRRAREAGRPAIVATQMLESMLHAARPTRAEATDVANAVLDGADAVMLSGETAIGEFPFEAASTAMAIASYAESEGGRFRTTRSRGGRRARARRSRGRSPSPPPPTSGSSRDVLHRDGPHGAAAVGGASRRADLRLRPARRRSAFDLSALGRARPARARADRHRRDDRDDGRRVSGTTGWPNAGDAVVMAAASPAGRTTTNMLKIHSVGMPAR